MCNKKKTHKYSQKPVFLITIHILSPIFCLKKETYVQVHNRWTVFCSNLKHSVGIQNFCIIQSLQFSTHLDCHDARVIQIFNTPIFHNLCIRLFRKVWKCPRMSAKVSSTQFFVQKSISMLPIFLISISQGMWKLNKFGEKMRKEIVTSWAQKGHVDPTWFFIHIPVREKNL